MPSDDLVNRVRLYVLERTIETSRAPTAREVAAEVSLPDELVLEAFRDLAERHVYVLEPGDPTRFRMVNPFSAVPTTFVVSVGGRRYFGNCVWDSLGIVSLLGGEGIVDTSCPDCDEPLSLKVSNHHLVEADGVVHFAVPARQWWNDIVFT